MVLSDREFCKSLLVGFNHDIHGVLEMVLVIHM